MYNILLIFGLLFVIIGSCSMEEEIIDKQINQQVNQMDIDTIDPKKATEDLHDYLASLYTKTKLYSHKEPFNEKEALRIATYNLQRGADADTLIFESVRFHNKPLLELLLQYMKDIYSRKKDYNCTILCIFIEYFSCSCVFYDLIKLLINQYKIDINDPINYKNETALILAVKFCFVPLVRLFLENGADLNEADRYGNNILSCINSINIYTDEPILQQNMKKKNKEDTIELLIFYGVDIQPFMNNPKSEKENRILIRKLFNQILTKYKEILNNSTTLPNELQLCVLGYV